MTIALSMKKLIRPIETVYKGYRFRSRLEARWAVFFDALPIEWEYEKEGFDIAGVRYLPDFWLPPVKMWAEVKPEKLDRAEMMLATQLANQTGFPVLFLVGIPFNHPYWAVNPDGSTLDYCLTNYHNYPRDEGRFYCMPGSEDDSRWDDTEQAAIAARQARFEHGESPRIQSRV